MSSDQSDEKPEGRQCVEQRSSMALQAIAFGLAVIGLFSVVLFVPMAARELWTTLLVGGILALAGILVLTRHIGNKLKLTAIVYGTNLAFTACLGLLYFSKIVSGEVLKWLALPLAYPILVTLVSPSPFAVILPKKQVLLACFLEVLILASGAYTIAILWGWL